MKITNMQY